MTPAEDKRYHELHDKFEDMHTRWRCIRDETWGDQSKAAIRREDCAWVKAVQAQNRLLVFEIKMQQKYGMASNALKAS
jgi:hypothetical protein